MRSFQGWIFALCFGLTGFAHAAVLSIVGLQDTSNPATNTSSTFGSAKGTGGGALLSMHLGERTSVETGVLQFNRSWTDNTYGSNTFTGTIVQVPLTFQYHLTHWFSVGAGGYYSTNSGNLVETGTVSKANLTYAGYGITAADYGVVATASVHFLITRSILFRLEERYTQGSPNLSVASGTEFRNRDMQTLVGLSFLLGWSGGGEAPRSH